jgi:glyoxylate reductase
MKKAFITRRLPDEALAIVAAACDYELWDSAEEPVPRALLLEKVRDVEGLLCLISDRIDAELLDHAPGLRIVANMAVGYDNVEVAALRARGVALSNTPDVLTDATADLAWALLLAAARRIVEGQKLIEADQWRYWAPLFMVGQDFRRATLGVVGAGRIGATVLRRAQGFDMQLIYHNRRPNAALEAQTGAAYRAFDQLLQEADFIVVTVPLSEETRGMFGAREFALMKPNAVFVNVARGPIIDEIALYDALKAGRPWAAGLDVFANEPIRADHPLLSLPNLVAVPHIGSATLNTRIAMATLAARNLAAA